MLGLAGLAFAACSNDDNAVNGGNGREDGNVRVTLSLGKAGTRSLSQSAANLYNNIDPNNVQVVFYNSQGNYIEMPETVAGKGENGGDYDNMKAISDAFTNLKDGGTSTTPQTLLLKGIPATATQLYIVTNNPNGAIETTSLNAAKASVVSLRSQYKDVDVANGILFSGQNATMTGRGDIPTDVSTPATATEDAVYEVTVELKPVPSRMEIQNVRALTADADWAGAEIASFTVDGFYINQFYPYGQLDGTQGPEEDRITNGSDPNKYAKNEYEKITYEQETDFSFMCDEPTTEMTYATGADGSNIVYAATTNATGEGDQAVPNWWGYQVMPGVVPHIVVKLHVKYAGETYEDGNNGELKFLTIVNYTRTDNNSSLGGVARGEVYRIENLDFQVDDLTDVPYEGTKSISATVRVLPWNPVTVTPEFN